MMCSQSTILTETVLILNRVMKGYYKIDGTGYDSYGNPITNLNVTVAGFDISMSLENVVQLYNMTISDTRMSLDTMFFNNQAADSPSAFLGGLASRYENYATSTFELDGSIHTFPSQAVSTNPGVWQEGPSTKSIVVDENTMYSTQGVRLLSDTTYDITKTCLNPNQILH